MQTDTTDSKEGFNEPCERYAVIIANPISGFLLHNTHRVHETLAFLRKHGWRAELWFTHGPGDGQSLARKAIEQNAAMVIAAGGDGTINDIIQALAGSETALGVLPTGTVNVWAREMGIPLDNAGAREVLLHGQTRRIDLGCVNGRYFLLMVGVGLDARIVYELDLDLKGRLGKLAYWHGGFRQFGRPVPRFILSGEWRRYVDARHTMVPIPVPRNDHMEGMRWAALCSVTG